MAEKVTALQKQVTTLEKKVDTLESRKENGTTGNELTGDASLLETVEARLELKIEASMEASSVIVADTMNARFVEALKMFESHITRRREEEEATKELPNPPAQTRITTPRETTQKPTQSHNQIDLRREEGDVNSAGEKAKTAEQP